MWTILSEPSCLMFMACESNHPMPLVQLLIVYQVFVAGLFILNKNASWGTSRAKAGPMTAKGGKLYGLK